MSQSTPRMANSIQRALLTLSTRMSLTVWSCRVGLTELVSEFCFCHTHHQSLLTDKSTFPLATRQSTLVFCVNLAHLRDLTATFRNNGIDARYVYAATHAAERKDLIDSFRKGEFPVLLNVGMSFPLAILYNNFTTFCSDSH